MQTLGTPIPPMGAHLREDGSEAWAQGPRDPRSTPPCDGLQAFPMPGILYMCGAKECKVWKIMFSAAPSGFQVDFTEEAHHLKLSPAVGFPLVISTISDAEMTGPWKTAAEQVVTCILFRIFPALGTKSHRYVDRCT